MLDPILERQQITTQKFPTKGYGLSGRELA
jgi:hypothetical protein